MPKIRVLIVDDSTVIRRLVAEALGRDAELEVVGTAANGKIALAKMSQVVPDAVTLDVEMPDMDGVATLREIRKSYPRLPVIMFSTLTQRGAVTTLEALSAGATDYVTKPTKVTDGEEAVQQLERELIPKIKAHCRLLLPLPAAPKITFPSARPASPTFSGTQPLDIVAIGCSTGGPNALAELVKRFPADFEVPVVVVQHMPPIFTQMLADRLSTFKTLICHEGAEGQVIEPGHLYIAPGGKHMELSRPSLGGPTHIHLHEKPPENSCRPAVDVLFRSVASLYGSNILAAVLTGMGQDGLHGSQSIRERGGYIIAQDEASSVVWGMPGYVANAGVAHRVLPLDQIAQEIVRRVRESRRSPSPLAQPCR